MSTVLVVDDDQSISMLLQQYLQERGLDVYTVSSGLECLDFIVEQDVQAIVLDVMMPGIDGFETLREIRKVSNIPVIMLTARGESMDRIIGLEMGADDYVSKPFEPRELLARLKALFRRMNRVSEPKLSTSIQIGDLELIVDQRKVLLNSEPISLTGMEFNILQILLERTGRVVTRDGMMNALKGEDWIVYDRSIDVHISHIRKKLGDASIIKTIRGVGYLVTP
jgi:DNA-binding response OmpR family regulator